VIVDKKYTLFWGLMTDVTNSTTGTSGWGCPIALYKTMKDGTLTTWNKVTVYFSIPSFPTT